MFERLRKNHIHEDNVLVERRRHQRPFPKIEVEELHDESAWELWEEAVLVQETALAVSALMKLLVEEAAKAPAVVEMPRPFYPSAARSFSAQA